MPPYNIVPPAGQAPATAQAPVQSPVPGMVLPARPKETTNPASMSRPTMPPMPQLPSRPSMPGQMPTSLPGIAPAPSQISFHSGFPMEQAKPFSTMSAPPAPSMPGQMPPSLPGHPSAPLAPSIPGQMPPSAPGYPSAASAPSMPGQKSLSLPGLPSATSAPSMPGQTPPLIPGHLATPPAPSMPGQMPPSAPGRPSAPSGPLMPGQMPPSTPPHLATPPALSVPAGPVRTSTPTYAPAQPVFVAAPQGGVVSQRVEYQTSAPLPIPTYLSKAVHILPNPLRKVVLALLMQVTDPVPEAMQMDETMGRLQAGTSQFMSWGWLPVVTFISALGLFVVNIAYNMSRSTTVVTLSNYTQVEVVFIIGLLLIFTPAVVRLLAPSTTRFERIGLLFAVGIMLYLVQMTNSPLHFSNFNEFLHWNTADSIATTGHLYMDDNTLLPVSPYYPGLEIVTNVLSSLSGLSTFHAGVVVLGVDRLLILLSLFFLYEKITQSGRMAGIATIIYATNVHFISFDVQFSYESMALPLAVFLLFVLSLLDSLPHKQIALTALAWLTLSAVAITHHMTDYVFDGFLLLWLFTYRFQKPTRHHFVTFGLTVLLGFALSLGVAFLVPNNPAVNYLSSYFGGAFAQLAQVATGGSHARALFQGASGLPSPIWDHLLSAIGVVIVALALPFALLCVWLRQRTKSLALMFGIAALGYPLSQAFRFTSFGTEITDRSAAFLFIPIAYVLALMIIQLWPVRRMKHFQIAYLSGAIAIIFISGVVLQAGPGMSFLPGSYIVSADNRSIETEGIQDATWAATYLGSGHRVATDRINRLLMSTYGKQYVISNLDNAVDTSPVFFAPTLGPNEISLLHLASVRYLVVDMRMSKQTPLEGVYFEDGEPDSYNHSSPIPAADLTKFNTISGVNRVFDSGDIQIYDVGGLLSAP